MASITQTARRIGRRGLVVLSVTATMAISGVAFASWTLVGEGTGTADAAIAAALTPVTITVAADLYPGLTTDAVLSVTNTNSFPVLVTAVTFSGAVLIADPGTCTAGNSEVTFADPGALSFTIAANATDTTTLTGIVAMGAGTDNGCQGKTFTRDFDLTAAVG